MGNVTGPLGTDERGASQVLGAVLLIAVVITGSLVVVALGSDSINQVRDQSDNRQASTILQELDSRYASLSSSGDDPQTTFDLGSTNPSEFVVRSQGQFNVTVNDEPHCSANITMSSVRFQDDNGRTVAYEGGGVWERAAASEGSSMVSAPSVTYRAGTIDIEIVNITGDIDQDTNVARLREAQSDAQSARLSRQLRRGDCMRPDSVTIQVQSTFYEAWGDYIESEFGVEARTYEANSTAVARLEQSDLPTRVNDSANNVVNLSSSAYNTVSFGADSITVDKDADNVYAVSSRPLQRGSLHIGNVTEVEADAEMPRRGMDVVFVLDESGSMAGAASAGGTKSQAAQTASEAFVAGLNDSKDRAGVVSYDDTATYRVTPGTSEYLTGDLTMAGVNGSIDSVPDVPSGGTHTDRGMEHANNVFDLQSNEDRERVMIVLTDGENDDVWYENPGDSQCDNDNDPDDCRLNRLALDNASDAAANGITIYTIGYGDDHELDEAFLREVAAVGNGEYYQATDAAQLTAIFDDIRRSVARTQAITRTPVSTNYSSSEQVYAPQAAGDVDQVADHQINGNDFRNINDPTAESRFSHTFAVSGGDTVTMEGYDFGCDEVVDTGRRRSHNGTVYRVARCSEISRLNATYPPSGIYHDGDSIAHLLRQDRAWWQEDINDTFAAHDDISVNNTAGAQFGQLELESNQALVWYDLSNGTDANNRLLMLYDIGIAESDAQSAGVINVRVNTVEIED